VNEEKIDDLIEVGDIEFEVWEMVFDTMVDYCDYHYIMMLRLLFVVVV
jgi:hypothetical protein